MDVLDIPEGVPLGLLIGKGGSKLRVAEQTFGVRAIVDAALKKIVISGVYNSETRELVRRHFQTQMSAFLSTKRSAYAHPDAVFSFILNGPEFVFKFEKHEIRISPIIDTLLKNFQFKLVTCGPRRNEIADVSARDPFFMPLDDLTVRKVAADIARRCGFVGQGAPRLAAGAAPAAAKLKATVGQLFYNPCLVPDGELSFCQLQHMRYGQHLKSKFMDVLPFNCEQVLPLLERVLTEAVGVDKYVPVLSLKLANKFENSSFSVKFHKIDGKWVLRKTHDHRRIHALVNAHIDKDVALRWRVVSRAPSSVEAQKIAEKHIVIQDYDFHTTAILTNNPPAGLEIDETVYKLKTHVSLLGLRFTHCILDPTQRAQRLECRLIERNVDVETGLVAIYDKLLPMLRKHNGGGPARVDRRCAVCFDSELELVVCANQHEICQPCFQQYVETSLNEKSLETLRRCDGKIQCPSCDVFFSVKQVAAFGGESLMMLWAAKMRAIGENEGVKATRELFEKEYRMPIRKQIEEALCLNCPHCQAAFIDYDGCDAVSCSTCSKSFCGLCLKACTDSSDAHTHAARCGQKTTRNYYSHAAFQQEQHRQLKVARVNAILEKCTPQERQFVLENFKKPFSELKITL